MRRGKAAIPPVRCGKDDIIRRLLQNLVNPPLSAQVSQGELVVSAPVVHDRVSPLDSFVFGNRPRLKSQKSVRPSLGLGDAKNEPEKPVRQRDGHGLSFPISRSHAINSEHGLAIWRHRVEQHARQPKSYCRSGSQCRQLATSRKETS